MPTCNCHRPDRNCQACKEAIGDQRIYSQHIHGEQVITSNYHVESYNPKQDPTSNYYEVGFDKSDPDVVTVPVEFVPVTPPKYIKVNIEIDTTFEVIERKTRYDILKTERQKDA